MINEIIQCFKNQLKLYEDIYLSLKDFNNETNINIEAYHNKLENVDFELERIKKLNTRVEQLKVIYVLNKKIDDFTADNIKSIEGNEKYNELKVIIDRTSEKILQLKKIQDEIISKINKEVNYARKSLEKMNPDKVKLKYNSLKYLASKEELSNKYINNKK